MDNKGFGAVLSRDNEDSDFLKALPADTLKKLKATGKDKEFLDIVRNASDIYGDDIPQEIFEQNLITYASGLLGSENVSYSAVDIVGAVRYCTLQGRPNYSKKDLFELSFPHKCLNKSGVRFSDATLSSHATAFETTQLYRDISMSMAVPVQYLHQGIVSGAIGYLSSVMSSPKESTKNRIKSAEILVNKLGIEPLVNTVENNVNINLQENNVNLLESLNTVAETIQASFRNKNPNASSFQQAISAGVNK